MEKEVFNMSEPGLSQDLSLLLQSKILSYIREALVYDKGYVVLAATDVNSFDFEVYHTDGKRIDAVYEETREETVDRILYTIDCSKLCKYKEDKKAIQLIMHHLYNYVLGALSIRTLTTGYHIVDNTDVFEVEHVE